MKAGEEIICYKVALSSIPHELQ